MVAAVCWRRQLDFFTAKTNQFLQPAARAAVNHLVRSPCWGDLRRVHDSYSQPKRGEHSV